MILPTFFVLGAPKAGTTSLCRHLARHPDVFLSSHKEPDFFNKHYARGLSWYQQFFGNYQGQKAIGDGSVLYSVTCLWPETPARIARHVPGALLIYMARHPIERIESMWCQHVANGDRVPAFEQAVREWRPLLEGSLYSHQLSRYRAFFPDEQILLLELGEFARDAKSIGRRCFEFLGVDSLVSLADVEVLNSRSTLGRDRALLALLRHTRLGTALRRRLPESVKEPMRQWMRGRLDAEPAWSEGTLKWAIDQLREDAERYLRMAGLPESTWDLSPGYVDRKLREQRRPAIPGESMAPWVLGVSEVRREG